MDEEKGSVNVELTPLATSSTPPVTSVQIHVDEPLAPASSETQEPDVLPPLDEVTEHKQDDVVYEPEMPTDFDCGRPPFVPIPTHVSVMCVFLRHNSYVLPDIILEAAIDDMEIPGVIRTAIALELRNRRELRMSQYAVATPHDTQVVQPAQAIDYTVQDPNQYPPQDPNQFPIQDPSQYPPQDPNQYAPQDPHQYLPQDPNQYLPQDPNLYPIEGMPQDLQQPVSMQQQTITGYMPDMYSLRKFYELYESALLSLYYSGEALQLQRWGIAADAEEDGSAAQAHNATPKFIYSMDLVASADATNSADREEEDYKKRITSSIMDQKLVRQMMETTRSGRYNSLNFCERCCVRLDDWWQQEIQAKKHLIPLFRTSIDRIETQFGPSTGSYFFFARSVFWLNAWIAFIALAILVPGLIESDWSEHYLANRYQASSYVTVPAVREFTGFVFGKGMEDSFLFYGEGYPTTILSGSGYKIDIAWIFVVTAVFIVSVIDSLSRFETAAAEDERGELASNALRIVFGGFNHNMRDPSDFKKQTLHLSSTMYTLLLTREEDEHYESTSEAIGSDYYLLKLRRFTGYLFSVAFMAGSAVLIAYLVLQEDAIRDNARGSVAEFAELIVPISISALKFFVPFILRQLVRFEKYARTKDTARHIALRIYFMKMFFVLVVLFQTLSLKEDELRDGICPQTIMGILYYRLFMTDIVVDVFCSIGIPMTTYYAARFCSPCREINPDDYRHDGKRAIEKAKKRVAEKGCCASSQPRATHALEGADEIKAIPEAELRQISAISRYLRITDRMTENEIFKPEFRVPENLIELMYKQALVWAAIPFCPVIPYIAMIGIAAVFYAKRTAVLHYSRLPQRPIGIRSQTNMFRTMMLSTLALMCIPFTYWMNMRVKCGPHTLLCQYDPLQMNDPTCVPTPVQSALRWVATLPKGVEVAVNLLQTTGLLWLVIFLLFIYGVLISKRYAAENSQVKELRNSLSHERADMRKFREVYRIKNTNTLSTESAKSYFRIMLQQLSPMARSVIRVEFVKLEIQDMIALGRIKPDDLTLVLTYWAARHVPAITPQDIQIVKDAQQDYVRSNA